LVKNSQGVDSINLVFPRNCGKTTFQNIV